MLYLRRRSEKSLPLLWNVLKKTFDPKKKSCLDGALLELKKWGEPCNCRELVIIIIFVVLSLHGNKALYCEYINT